MHDFGYILAEKQSTLRFQAAQDFGRDGISVQNHFITVERCAVTDTAGQACSKLAKKAHRDGAQLIPPQPDGLYWQQYAGAELIGCTIINSHFHGYGTQMQGVFASDGLFRELTIVGNRIVTDSQHKIAISGLVSGYIANNRDDQDQLVRIQLDGFRPGAGVLVRDKAGREYWHSIRVLSFLDRNDDYWPADRIVGDRTLDHVVDNRRTIGRATDTYLSNFDIVRFRALAAAAMPRFRCMDNAVNHYCAELQRLAMQCGDQVYAA